jgi:hypothetical protein
VTAAFDFALNPDLEMVFGAGGTSDESDSESE